MQIPPELFGSALASESNAISGMQRLDEFEIDAFLAPLSSTSPSVHRPVFLNNVHMIAGENNPWLGREILLNSELASSLSPGLLAQSLESVSDIVGVGHEDMYRDIVRSVIAACEAVDEESSSALVPFRTIGLLAVYITDQGDPFVCGFRSTAFSRELGKHIEPPAPLSDLKDASEAHLELTYGALAEHAINIEPFDEWKLKIKDSLGEVEDLRHVLVPAFINNLLVPGDAIHPTIRRQLFEARQE